MRTFFKTLRISSAITLFFFCWTYMPLYAAVAWAAEPRMRNADFGMRNETQKTATTGERFEKALEAVREKIGKAQEKLALSKVEGTADITAEVAEVKAKRTDIEKIDIELRKEFSGTEKKLKDAKLPKEILDRHYKFVKHYEDNLAELKANLEEVGKYAAGSKQGKEALKKAKAHLEKTKPPTKHVPLDPNKLPFRTVKAKERAPRLKKEEFKKDFPTQKAPAGLRSADFGLRNVAAAGFSLREKAARKKPFLVASNGSLTGLLPSNPELGTRNSLSDYLSAPSAPSAVNAVAPNFELGTSNYELALATADLPTSDDLAETAEVQFTADIRAKAQELGYSPVKIYEWVRNNIEFVPTYGSIQGADMCLQTKQCNAFDTASLLIALLRTSGIPARYVYGTIEVPIDKIKNLVGGFTDSTAALTLIASGGIPVAAGTSGGVITKARLEHVWIETHVAYGPYSGRTSNLNPDKIWVPLDPSFKQYAYTVGLDLQTAVPFDGQAFANQVQSTATINESEGYVTNVDSNYIQTTLTNYQTQIQNYISQNTPNATVGDIIGKKEIKKQELGILPVTLPYKTVTTGVKCSEVPDSLRHKVTFEIQDDPISSNSLSYTTSIAEITGKKVTLSYASATAFDEQTINTYGGIFNVPAYLVNMTPLIKIEGFSMATGNSIGLGNQQTLNMRFSSPSHGTDVVSNKVTVGAYYGIGVNPNKIPQSLIDKRRAKLEAVKSSVSNETIYSDDYIGELLYATSMTYFYELDALTDVVAKNYDIGDLKHVSEAIVSKELSVASLYGMPTKVEDASMMIDVDRLIHSSVSQSGDSEKERLFTMAAGQMSSALEHGIFEQMYKAKGVSTMQILQVANSQGIPVYTITSSNVSSVLPNLQLASEVKTDIQSAINAGKHVVVPKQNVTYSTWTGTGYMVLDPVTGSGAYMISTSLANGGCCVAAGGLAVVFLSLIGASDPWYSLSCSITTLIHYFNTPVEFLGMAAFTGGLGVVMVVLAFEYASTIGPLAAFLLGGVGVLVAFAAAIIIVMLIRGLIDSFSNHAYNSLYERRILYARKYHVLLS